MSLNTKSGIIFLSSADPSMADRIGNKAASLSALMRASFDVPNGFCLPTEMFGSWKEKGQIDEAIRADIIEAFEQLRAPVAVRSSSPAEDRADASFAGQYATILGVRTVDELMDAIVTCWQSAGSAQATAYREDHDTATDVAMAVLVQELVPATSSGVLFTQHPVTNRTDELVVNSNFGLGESVVSGRAEPDTFVLDKNSGEIISSLCGSKRVWTRLADDGLAEDVDAPPEHAGKLSLTPSQLHALADAARRLEDYFDRPIDAEWAFEDDRLYTLQARPVTTGYHAYLTQFLDDWARERGLRDDKEAVWSLGGPISSLPTSPLYYSEMSAFFSDMFPAIAQLHGAGASGRKEFRYFRGFAYTNRAFSSTADPSGALQPLSLSSPAWRSTLKLSLKHPRTLAVWSNIDRYYRNWAQVWGPEIEAARPDYTTANNQQIRDFVEILEVQRRTRSIYAACAVGYAGDLLGLLLHLLQKWAPDASEDAVGLLTSGVDGSLTHRENQEVWHLGEIARQEPAVERAILAGAYDKLDRMPEARDFLNHVDELRSRRAHRGSSDRDLRQPRWGDSRLALLEQVNNMIRLGENANPDAAHRRAADRRLALEADIREQIQAQSFGALKFAFYQKILRATQRYWMHRDNQRHTFDRYFYELRCAYRAIGRNLAEAGVLQEADDIFFLSKTEIYACLDGEISGDRLSQRAIARREWWNEAIKTDPPPLIQGEASFDDSEVNQSEFDIVATGGSPGTITGPVRLVRNMQELRDAQPGEIVVTQAIDPAWTPVFGIIGGVISEEGGMLSHATVLGREYGLPVVIGASGATRLLQTGEIVSLNGSAGTVRRVDSEDTGQMA